MGDEMIKRLAVIAMLMMPQAAFAEIWATGDCTTASGTKIRYALREGRGFISYDGEGPYEMFSEKKGDVGVITHIGSKGNMVLAIDLNTGRGYIITQFDNGRKNERNVSCRLGSVDR